MLNNDDLIRRGDLLAAYDAAHKGPPGGARKLIEDAPAVDAVQVVHGRWIGIEYDGYADGKPVYDKWECSECGWEIRTEEPPNYCEICGAKMDAEE